MEEAMEEPDDNEEDLEGYSDLEYFLIVMSVQGVVLIIICFACAIYHDRMREAELGKPPGEIKEIKSDEKPKA